MANHTFSAKEEMLVQGVNHREEKYVGKTEGGHEYSFLDLQNKIEDEEIELLEQWKDALTKIEALLYVAYGAPPASYADNLQWWLNDDPRSYYPGQMVRYHFGFVDEVRYYPTVASGKISTENKGGSTIHGDTGYFDWARSVDHLWAEGRTKLRHPEYFPKGSVTRSFSDTDGGDAAPGATVTITYHAPESVRERIEAIKISYVITHMISGGGTSPVLTPMSTADDGETYTFTFDGEDDLHFCSFQIHVENTDKPRPHPSVPYTIYDPPHPNDGYEQPPGLLSWSMYLDNKADEPERHTEVTGMKYYFAWLEHKHPYQYGLPEMLWRKFTPPHDRYLRKCTGLWRFDSLTDIKPGLINICRFALDSFGRNGFQINPEMRGGDKACCVNMPVTFRWTGANVYPHYQDGDNSPLHAFSDASGNVDSRRSWRGLPAFQYLLQGRDAYLYGGDESWLSWDHIIDTIAKDEEDEWYPGVNQSTRYRGLHPGDRIEIRHLEEIIRAVNWLIEDNGLWLVHGLQSCKRTPTHCLPWTDYLPGDTNERRYIVSGSSGSYTTYSEFQSAGGWCTPGVSRAASVPFAKPNTAAICRAGSGQDCVASGAVKTLMYTIESKWYHYIADAFIFEWAKGCRPAMFDSGLTDKFHRTCGLASDAQAAAWHYGEDYQYLDAATVGYSYYLCGGLRRKDPPGSGSGWNREDENHGNGFSFGRLPHSSCTGEAAKQLMSMGNHFDTVMVCDSGSEHMGAVEVPFDEVTEVQFNGVATPWVEVSLGSECSWDADDLTDVVPGLPGLGWASSESNAYGFRRPLCKFRDLGEGITFPDDYSPSNEIVEAYDGTAPKSLFGYDGSETWTAFRLSGGGIWTVTGVRIYKDGEQVAAELSGELFISKIGHPNYGDKCGDLNQYHGIILSYSGPACDTIRYYYEELHRPLNEFKCVYLPTYYEHCAADSPKAYHRVDLNIISGVPWLKNYDLGIRTTSGNLPPDTLLEGETLWTIGGVNNLCWD